MLKIILFYFVILFQFQLFAQYNSLDEIMQEKELRVCVWPEYYGISYLDIRTQQFIGIDTSYENLILAYEPVWAIGTGITATNEDIKQVHNAIKSKINKPLLYGGSVKVENVKEICEIENVDGALIGTASWKIEDFIKILENTKDIR